MLSQNLIFTAFNKRSSKPGAAKPYFTKKNSKKNSPAWFDNVIKRGRTMSNRTQFILQKQGVICAHDTNLFTHGPKSTMHIKLVSSI